MNRIILMAAILVVIAFSIGPVSSIDAAEKQNGVDASADASFDPAKIAKLAVVVVGTESSHSRHKKEQGDTEREVEDDFVQVLMRKGYTISSRSDLDAVMKEQHFQRSGLTESDAAAIGKVLNVSAVMMVRVTELNAEKKQPRATKTKKQLPPTYLATAGLGVRLIDVEKASVLWIGKSRSSKTVGGISDFSGLLSDVAKRVASAFPGRKPAKSASSPGNGS